MSLIATVTDLLHHLYSRLHSSLISPSLLPPPRRKVSGLTWQEIAKQAQQHRDASIAALSPLLPAIPWAIPQDVSHVPRLILSDHIVSITERSPEELVAKIASGELTSVEVTKAFLRRAGLAQKLVWNSVVNLYLPVKDLESKELANHLQIR
jgi:hypothetical protein